MGKDKEQGLPALMSPVKEKGYEQPSNQSSKQNRPRAPNKKSTVKATGLRWISSASQSSCKNEQVPGPSWPQFLLHK